VRKRRAKLPERLAIYLDKATGFYTGRLVRGRFVGVDLRKALIHVKRALMGGPDNYDALVLMGNILEELSEESEGALPTVIRYYDRAIKLRPKRHQAYASKARAFFNANKYAKPKPPRAGLLILSSSASGRTP
jgi:hypothetical protein